MISGQSVPLFGLSRPKAVRSSKDRMAKVFLLSFRRIDLATTTFGSTKSEITGGSVPPSGLASLRVVGPLLKHGRRKSGSHPILPAAIPPRRYSDI